jgi:hypothetical protein
MDDLLVTALSYPTVIYSLFFVVVSVYWLFVVLGALDIDVIQLGGEVEGAAEGAAEGLAEGAAEGLAEGAAEGAGEAAGEGAGEGAEAGGLAGVLAALRLRSAPVTVTFSMLTAFGWLFSYLGTSLVAPTLGTVLPTFVWGTLVFIAAFLLSVPLAALVTRPLGRLFATHTAPTRDALLGKLCALRTGRADSHFGQAEVADGGAGHLIEVRCDSPNTLKRGDEALVIEYDRQREAFLIEPMTHIMDERRPLHEDSEDIAEALAEA